MTVGGAASDGTGGLGFEARLRAEGLDPGSWGNGPDDRYAPHQHGYDKVIVVTAGSITFGLPGAGGSIVLSAGDRLELPAGTEHDGLVGRAGVMCLEAHLVRGSLGTARRIPAGEW
jgi:uncharacterized protein YjlB